MSKFVVSYRHPVAEEAELKLKSVKKLKLKRTNQD